MKSIVLTGMCLLLLSCASREVNEYAPVEVTTDMLDASGLVKDEHLTLVLANCTACHSAKLVSQNRATREGWTEMIRWMQASQNLWELGENESKILDYLEKNYGPVDTGRRKQLEVAEWYMLE